MSFYFVLCGDEGILYKGNDHLEMRTIRDNYQGDKCILYSYHKNGNGLDIRRSDWERDRTHRNAPFRSTHQVGHITLDEISMKLTYDLIGRMLKSNQGNGDGKEVK